MAGRAAFDGRREFAVSLPHSAHVAFVDGDAGADGVLDRGGQLSAVLDG